MFVGQFDQAQAAFVGLLFDFMRGENRFDGYFSIGSNLFCPIDKPFRIPLNIRLMIRRHMFEDGGILTGIAIEPRMRTDPLTIVKHLNDQACYSNIDFAFDILIGDRIVHLDYVDVE